MPRMKPCLRKWMLLPVLMALLLSACSASSSLTTGTADTMRRASQLALGTVSLEGTEQAVDAAAATQLLPIWELLSDLRASSTTAPEELAATVEAIEAAMTADQLAAIEAMDLPTAEVAEAGPARVAESAMAASEGASAQAGAMAESMAMGGDAGAAIGAEMPMDGGMPPGGFNQAPASGSRSGGSSSSGPYGDVITLLKSKTQS